MAVLRALSRPWLRALACFYEVDSTSSILRVRAIGLSFNVSSLIDIYSHRSSISKTLAIVMCSPPTQRLVHILLFDCTCFILEKAIRLTTPSHLQAGEMGLSQSRLTRVNLDDIVRLPPQLAVELMDCMQHVCIGGLIQGTTRLD
jgi:hypothetical protein